MITPTRSCAGTITRFAHLITTGPAIAIIVPITIQDRPIGFASTSGSSTPNIENKFIIVLEKISAHNANHGKLTATKTTATIPDPFVPKIALFHCHISTP